MPDSREIQDVFEPQPVIEGAGVRLLRSFGPRRANPFDPFLLFDHFAFNDPREGPIQGFPMHPHRGIETVTYMLAGSVRHRDSLDNLGAIGPGDVQWMTSGRGILHEEMPQRGPGGAIDGFQLWVNLPARLKMSAPRYQEVTDRSIPVVEAGGARVRLVAGKAGAIAGPVSGIAADPLYMDVRLQAHSEWRQSLPVGHTALAYVFEGAAYFGGERVAAVRMVQFGPGETLHARAGELPARFMLMAGAPFGEPIVPYGPFVMNTEQEIYQAIADLRRGTFAQR